MALAHSPSIITNGLVLCLDAANRKSYPGSGTTWTDLSGRGNNGTLVNGSTYNSGNNGSIVFDGVDDAVRVSNPSISKSCSICFWFKHNSPGTWKDIFTFQTSADLTASRVEHDGNILNSNQYNWYGEGFVAGTVLFTHTGANFDYISLIFDANNATCYKNGVQTAQTVSSNFASASFIDMGKRLDAGDRAPWKGNIACFSIYNRALTAAEIQQNFNALRGRFGI